MNHRPYKLVLLLQDLEFGGTQRYAIQLAKHLDRRRFSPELWILRGGTDMVSKAQDARVPMVWLSRSSWVTPFALFRLFIRLLSHRPQILYTLTVVPNIWGRIFGKLLRTSPLISGYRGLFPKQYERWLWPISDLIICNARVLKEIMVRRFSVDPERIAVIYNGVDTNFFCPNARQRAAEPTVLYAGRLIHEKDPLTLLKAFHRLVQDLPGVHLEMVGNGPLRKRLEAEIENLFLQSRVRILPGTEDIRSHFQRAWALVLPSRREASPNVILEAMATGLPVVSTPVGGIPELVAHGQTGILVEPRNTRALTQALNSLLSNESRRSAMGAKGREIAMARYSLEKMVLETEQVLLETAGDILPP